MALPPHAGLQIDANPVTCGDGEAEYLRDVADNVLNLDQLSEDARRFLEGDVGEVISILGQAGGSPGGARPKALIGLNDEGHAVHGSDNIPDGFEAYLVKFPGHGDPVDIAAIEMAYAMMAKDAGVDMPETKLLSGGNGKMYFAAKRFDRVGNRRVHVHSASGLLYTDIRIPQLDYRDLILRVYAESCGWILT